MTASDIQCRLEAYLELRRSLGFVICYEAYALKELLQYIQAKGLAWPIHAQTILDWIAAAAPHCGPAGQRARLIHARGFLRHLKASFPETEVPQPGILAPVIRPNPYLLPRRGKVLAIHGHDPAEAPAARNHSLALLIEIPRTFANSCEVCLPAAADSMTSAR